MGNTEPYSDEIRDYRDQKWFWIDSIFVSEIMPHIGAIGGAVYMCLCQHSQNNGKDGRRENDQKCWLAIPTIAHECKVKKPTVEKYLRMLEELNVIHIQTRYRNKLWGTRENNTNVYSLIHRDNWRLPGKPNLLPRKPGLPGDKAGLHKQDLLNKTYGTRQQQETDVVVDSENEKSDHTAIPAAHSKDPVMSLLAEYGIVRNWSSKDRLDAFCELATVEQTQALWRISERDADTSPQGFFLSLISGDWQGILAEETAGTASTRTRWRSYGYTDAEIDAILAQAQRKKTPKGIPYRFDEYKECWECVNDCNITVDQETVKLIESRYPKWKPRTTYFL
jgi:hypothetical protein